MTVPIDYWKIGIHFLRLAEIACDELVKAENPYIVVSDQPINESETDAITKWSDHSIGIAVIFDFLHGIEVLLKGFIAISASAPHHHRLNELLSLFEQSFPNTRVGELIESYTHALDPLSPLGKFFAVNNVSIDDWYQALKYPESLNGRSFDHFELKYGGISTVPFWQSLGKTAHDLRKEAVAFASSNDQS